MTIESVHILAKLIRSSPVFNAKREIQTVARELGVSACKHGILNGDDAAAIPDGDGYLLLAAEGIISSLIAADPYLAGRSAVLANVNDIYAMGGRPLAMVDVICNSDDETTRELCRGMKDNAARFNVPLVGGHTSHNAGETSFSLSILGRAKCLITSFDAQPGDQLILAYNPHGIWLDSFGFWNSNNTRSDKQLQEDLELLPYVAEKSLSIAGKDVSMAGIIGTSLMLAEASRVGLQIDLDGIIVPEGISMSRWLLAFLSYGFLLAVKRQNVASLSRLFSARNLAALNIGSFESGSQLRISQGKEEICLWDWYEESFTGFQKP